MITIPWGLLVFLALVIVILADEEQFTLRRVNLFLNHHSRNNSAAEHPISVQSELEHEK